MILTLTRRKSISVLLLSKIFFLPVHKHISLDEIGSWVWENCDGRKTVGAMIKQMSAEFKLSRKEAEISLMSFLRSLSRKKLIGFAMKDRGEKSGD